MTDTTIPTDIERAEIGNEPLTGAEREAIKRYCDRIAGVPDCFDLAHEDGLGSMPEAFTHAEMAQLIKDYFEMLGDWRSAIADLAEELAEAIGNIVPTIGWPPAMSGAATRYVGSEMLDWHRALEGWRWGTIEFFLGRDKYGSRFDHFAPRPEDLRYEDGAYWINA
jgi:hypothetical protein